MEMRRCGVKPKEKETNTSEPLVTPTEPMENPSPFQTCLKHPIVCIGIGVILLSMFAAGAWVVSDRMIQRLEDISNVIEMWKNSFVTLENQTAVPPFIPDISHMGAKLNGTRKRQTLINEMSNGIKKPGYFTVENEGNGTLLIKKHCQNCSKIFFTKDQMLEIVTFVDSCNSEHGCDTASHRILPGQCSICNSVVTMDKSSFRFCLDVNSELACGIVGRYIFYPNTLEMLCKFYNAMIKTAAV